MDDHVYTQVLEYAECDLIPRFNEEYRKCGNIKACESYEEISDLCKILNTIMVIITHTWRSLYWR